MLVWSIGAAACGGASSSEGALDGPDDEEMDVDPPRDPDREVDEPEGESSTARSDNAGDEPGMPAAGQGGAGSVEVGGGSGQTVEMPVSPAEPSVEVASDCSVGPGRVGLQRLTRAEYNRTVRDLFGVSSNPANVFPSDSTTSGFDNNATSLGMSPQAFQLWLDAAEQVAAEAMQNRGADIVSCDAAADGAAACGRVVLEALALRVYRRPPDATELDDLMRFVERAETEGESFEQGFEQGFEQSIEHALVAMLVAPQFVYRNVPASAGQTGDVPLNEYALAARLSFFLWGSTPDDALLDSARTGALSEPASLRAEFDRMLADPKSDALYQAFFSQWLALGKLANAWPDPSVLPDFSDEVRDQMREEVRLFFEDIRSRDASALEFVTGQRTFANELLADVYGIDGVSGAELVPVDTDPNLRRGVLTMPAILTMTSDPTHTNIVKRGSWLAEAILCAAPPPPPQDVPPLPAPMDGETERKRLERHRADPVCAPCHDLIDPLGFAFENFDAVGRYRDTVDGEPADVVGRMPDGRTFSGVVGLVELLESGSDYTSCVSEKLFTYALGRTMGSAEQCVLDAVGERAVSADSKFSDLLWAVVTSAAFQRQEQEAP